MSASIRIGLIDSGIPAALATHVLAARRFRLAADRSVVAGSTATGTSDHGARMAGIILAAAPGVQLLDAQVFGSEDTGAAAAVAAALDWLRTGGARIVNMSLGLRADRAVLRAACEGAIEAGMLLVAAAPARGGPVYPAAFPGVISVCGDARCAPGEISSLYGEPAAFGACPYDVAPGATGGASYAAAHVTGRLASLIGTMPVADWREAHDKLASIARYHHRERKSATGGTGG